MVQTTSRQDVGHETIGSALVRTTGNFVPTTRNGALPSRGRSASPMASTLPVVVGRNRTRSDINSSNVSTSTKKASIPASVAAFISMVTPSNGVSVDRLNQNRPPGNPAPSFMASVRAATLTGVVPGTTVPWSEACEIRLDWKLDSLWLLLEPRVILELEDGTAEAMVAKAKDWVRERRAQRRNKHANSMLDGWIELIAGTSDSLRLRAFGISDGADADFEIARTTGFSGRAPQ